MRSSTFLSRAALVVSAAVVPACAHPADWHLDVETRSLPDTWYQPDHHPVHKLFQRDGPASYPAVGSPEWSAGFPATKADTATMPQSWLQALNASVAAGKIPNIPVSKQASSGSNPTYNGYSDPSVPTICSSTYQCKIDGQIWDGPAGTIGISFDDGPLPASDDLYQFLQTNNIPSTHFYIGTNILQNPKEFTTAYQTLHSDIAIHTWTHPYMTTLSNEQVVAELGWTMLLIYNSTGGRLARYWRPPYGDSDVRVTAIAKEVFGLTTVIWNQDTDDWELTENKQTQDKINADFDTWLKGPKSPGLIILEHELDNMTVAAFKTNYPKFAQNGWSVQSLARLNSAPGYQNAQDSSGNVVSVAGITAGAGVGLIASPTSSVLAASTHSDNASPTPSTTAAAIKSPKASGARRILGAGPLLALVSIFIPISLHAF